MTKSQTLPTDPRIDDALEELRALIAARYPDATFDVFHRDDPDGMRLRARVDIEDLDEVMDIVLDKLYEVQVERGLPVYVVTTHPHGRIEAQLRERTQRVAPIALPPLP